MTPLQVAWAGLAIRRPENRSLLIAGAAGSFVIAAIWVLSRVVGLPLGPQPFEPEAVSAKDLLATYAEAGVVLLVVMLLRDREPAARSWVPALAWVVIGASVLAAFLPGH